MTALADIGRDIRYAVRLLRRSPSFALVAILTLALGIGANTAIFSLVDAVLLKSLPVDDPERLVLIETMTPRGEPRNASHQMFQALRQQNDVFTGVLAAQDGTKRIEMVGPDGGGSEEATVQLVSGEYFDVLGVRPAAGRMLRISDDAPAESAVAVLSDSFWHRRFGRDPAIVGKNLRLKAHSITVIGVAPAGFFGESVGRAPELWLPLHMQPQLDRVSMLDDPRTGWLRIVGRLRPEIERGQAASAMELFLSRADPQTTHLNASTPFIDKLHLSDGGRGLPEFRERFSLALQILSGIVGLVLLVACANVSNLLLARAAMRQREVAVRLAIGAGRGRLVRQFLTESLLLAAVGAVLGVFFAWWGSALLLVLASDRATPIPIDVSPNLRVLAFTTGVSLIAVLIFGLTPALTGSNVKMAGSLTPTSATSRRTFTSNALVVAQIALSLVLITAAALLVQTFHNLRTRDLGFSSDGLLQGRIFPEQSGYKRDAIPDLSRRLVQRLENLPGAQGAALAHSGFATGMSRTCCFAVEGYRHEPAEDRQIGTLGVSAGYFQTMRIPVLRGRDFAPHELIDDPRRPSPVVIVNESFARRYLHGGDPIGRHIGWGDPPKVTYNMEVVGVVGDAVYSDPRQSPKPVLYFPSATGTMFVVRTTGSPEDLIATVRREIQSAATNLEFSMAPVSADVQRALVRERLLSTLAGFFGLLAAVLAGIGLYGLMAYGVTRRTREIGIRMALGAGRPSIVRAEVRTALLLAAVGIAVGIPAVLVSGTLIRNQLFGISSTDPATIAAAIGMLAVVSTLAACVPARRASRVEPTVALRCE